MKTNIIANNTIMKTYLKYLCAVLMIIGTSAHAWGAASISGSITSKTINVDDDHAEGYFTFTVSSSNVEADPSGKFLNVYLDPYTDNDTYWFDCGFGTTSSEVGEGYYQSTSTSGTIGFYYYITEEGDYTTSIWVWGYEDAGTYDAIYYEVPVTISVHKSCTDRTVSFANATITKDFGTAAGKYQDYTIDHSGGTVTWTSDDPTIASVNNSTGVVTINKAGSTYINVAVASNGTYCAVEDFYELVVNAAAPVLATNVSGKEFAVSAITARGATFSGGVVTSKGNATITRYGFIIGTSATVVVGGTGANAPVASGFWNADIDLNTAFGSKTAVSNFSPNTTYYVRPFAYNGALYGYGTAVSFTTLNEYDIVLDKNNLDGGSADGLATVVENGTTIELVAPTRTGYHVEGYYTTDECVTKVATDAGALQANITVSATNWTNGSSQWVKGGDATFYTNWAANTYTITLNQNGGSGGDGSVTAEYGSAMPSATMPTTPPAVGKVFDGYYYNSVQYYDADGNSAHVWDVDDDVTLVASWTTASPTLSIASVDKVVISSTTPSLAEGASTSVAYNSTVTLSHGEPDAGYFWNDWNVYETGNTSNTLTVTNNQFTMPDYDVTVSAKLYSDLVFSCSELTLTPHLVTASTPIFITSMANQKVRSQDYITITGSGLTPNTPLTFPGLDSKFEVLTSTGGTISTDENGEINVNAYIFYTPAADATTDGLNQMAGLTVSVGGAKPKQASLVQSIIGRHLPTAGYVIAGKKDNKWYALPSTMASTSTPAPSEIAVDDINNPSVAYTAASNIYGLGGPTAKNISDENGQYIRFAMSINDGNEPAGPAPLFGSGTAAIGKSGSSKLTSDLSAGWWWALTQTNTSITNPQDAKYTIKCANSSNTLSIKNSPFVWGQYSSGIEELRLIPASDIPYTEAYFVEWGQHGGVIEVDATGIDATSVVAHLNGVSSSAITLSQTLTNGKSRATIYNYTVNFGDGIDFAAASSNGAMLTLEWKNGATLKAVSNIVVPKIIASSATMSSIASGDAAWSSAEVHVLPGVTLTANAGDFGGDYAVTINHLEIYPGATVVVTKGSQASGTLKVKTLVLRNGWTRAGEKAYDVARLYITPSTASLAKNAVSDVWYADWYIDYDQYYPIAVPWDVTLANITYRYCSVEPTVGHDKNIRLRYYDGSSRAGGGAIGTNWKLYGDAGAESVPTKLEPSKGYALTAKRPSGKAFSILRMPLTIPSADWTAGGEKGEVGGTHKDQVSVTGWGSGTAQWYAMGWNFIGNPYMCTFNGDDDGISGKLVDQQGKGVRYATIPDVDFKNYDQVAIADADLKPASGFFIQAENPEATYITFASSNIVPPSAPARYTTQEEAVPEQEAYIRLSYEGGKDQMGLIIGEDYTENYEVNADLAKVLGDGNFVKTYMQYGGMDMAYVAINGELAKAWIPVTVILPASGEYTYSLTASSEVEELEGVYLIDYANNNKITNLINENYVFTAAEAGTISNRFAINAIMGERKTPTGIDAISAGADLNSDKPFKFIWHDKVFILHHGVIYDATGKKVREINK